MVKKPEIQRALTEVNGLRLLYRDTGSAGEPMLCLHGRFGRGETWIDLMRRLGDRYRIIAPDQRGHGLSDRPVARYAAEDMAADAHELIVQLGCVPSTVVGHSMGGRIAAYVAALYPDAVKALVILDEGADGPETISDIPPSQIPPVDKLTADWPTPYPTYEKALSDLRTRLGRSTGVQYFLESLVETYQGYDFLFSRYAMSAIEEYRRGWHDVLASIECPVLLVRAVDSWCLSAEEADRMRSEIRNCTYFEVADSDHMLYADNPDEFYPRFEQFLHDHTIEPRVQVSST